MSMNRKRKNQILLRLSDEEYEIFKSKQEKTGLNQNEFLIALITKRQVKVISEYEKVHLELIRIGVNLNQIARKINSGKLVEQNFEPLKKEVDKIWQSLRQEKQGSL